MRAKAWQALGSAIEDERIREKLFAKLEDEQAPDEERSGALLGIRAGMAGNEPIRKFAMQFYEEPETRVHAMEAMRNSFDRSFAEYFPPHLTTPSPK